MPAARSKLGKVMDDKWVSMQDAQQGNETSEDLEMEEKMEQEEAEDSEDTDEDILSMTVEQLNGELQALEQLIVSSQNLGVTAGSTEICTPRVAYARRS